MVWFVWGDGGRGGGGWDGVGDVRCGVCAGIGKRWIGGWMGAGVLLVVGEGVWG